ncbi:MAG TPA: glycine--tRNA ligase subunit beta, partial [Burkholderiales bacterium]|nr:glycine--tRNA ligase subunit beta [Burkholderiales bacterium]
MARGKSAKSASASLLVEVLTEELPPKALKRLSDSFAAALTEDLGQHDFLDAGSAVHAFATPRRLAVLITHVRERAPDKPVELSGPSVKVGLDAGGNPTQALLGFARKHGVDVAKLTRRETPKGEFFFYEAIAPGGRLDAVLSTKVETALEKLPVPKVMRWGSGDTEFVRPVHGLIMLHGDRLIEHDVLGVASSKRTFGHRFLAPEAINIPRADDYEKLLRDKGHVIARFAARREEIISALARAAGKGAAVIAGDELLDEITSLVEWPVVLEGEFDPRFLDLPRECLVLSMQQHQKYVPLSDTASGRLLPRFLFVSNIATKDASEIVRGNERVLHARLSDARFFFDQDRKVRLETRVPRLGNVVYHNKLGTQLERVKRIELLAGRIARAIGANPLLAERAAELSKADLVTEMVGEFPELQGIMGGYYAHHDGEPEDVATAISAHYRPRFAGDGLPEGKVSMAVALADKLDTLAGLFSIGEHPTGDRDPFALRRAALGVIRIIVENELPLSLYELSSAAFELFPAKTPVELQHFFIERLRGYFLERGYSANEVEAVLSAGTQAPASLIPRQLEAVRAFARLPEAESLAAANKRVANLLKQAQAKGESFANADAGKLKEPAELALFTELKTTGDSAMGLYERGDYTGYLSTFAALKRPVDDFFDSVMVMVDDR